MRMTSSPMKMNCAIQFKASRGTVREAIRLLVDEGLLRREQGRGTFVNALQRSGMFTLTSFDDEMLRQNRMPSTILVGLRSHSCA